MNWWNGSGTKMTIAGCLSLGFAAYGFVTGCFPVTSRTGGQPVCSDTSPEAYWIGLVALIVIGTLFVRRGVTR